MSSKGPATVVHTVAAGTARITDLLPDEKAKIGRMVEEVLSLRQRLTASEEAQTQVEARCKVHMAELQRHKELLALGDVQWQSKVNECTRLLRLADLRMEEQDRQLQALQQQALSQAQVTSRTLMLWDSGVSRLLCCVCMFMFLKLACRPDRSLPNCTICVSWLPH